LQLFVAIFLIKLFALLKSHFISLCVLLILRLIFLVHYFLEVSFSDLQGLLNRMETIAARLEGLCNSEGMKNKWLDGQEVLQLLHISLRTLQTYRDSGILPYSKLCGKIYYKAEDLEEILEKHSTKI